MSVNSIYSIEIVPKGIDQAHNLQPQLVSV